MPADSLLTGSQLLPVEVVVVVFKVMLLALAGLYFIFSLIMIRQVYLMTETVSTANSPLLRAFAILHAGFSLGITVLFIGFSLFKVLTY